jgi:serine/threonine protein kinase
MWGLGITIIALIMGEPPFPTDRGLWPLMNAILRGPEPNLGTSVEKVSPELNDFIHQCLNAPLGDGAC